MKKKASRPLLTTGTSTLLLIFISLCLLTFAVLSLLSARADRKLSQKTADRTTAYYEACNLAEDRLGEADEQLKTIWEETGTEASYFEALEKQFSDTGSSFSWDSTSRILSFSVPLTDTQVLSISLRAELPKEGESFYTITSWKTVNTSDWTPDTRQNVYVAPENS